MQKGGGGEENAATAVLHGVRRRGDRSLPSVLSVAKDRNRKCGRKHSLPPQVVPGSSWRSARRRVLGR